MSSRTFMVLIAFTLAGATVTATAQAVYRCGNEYTTVPCQGGSPVDVGNSAVVGRAAEGRQQARRERRLADEMVRDRRAREAALTPAGPTSLGPLRPQPTPSAVSGSKKPKKKPKPRTGVVGEDDFVATVPKAKKRN
ncbi:MAG: hypothetical protein ABI281_04610 [Caldimonas sp.]